MSLRIFVPKDSSAVSVGADAVAEALAECARDRDQPIEIVRTGSRGAYWLEPLVEVEIGSERHGFGPIGVRDVPDLLDAMTGSSDHSKAIGVVEDFAFFKKQHRILFRRCGVADPLGFVAFEQMEGLSGAGAALSRSPQQVIDQIKSSGLRGRGGAGFPAGIKWQTVADQPGDEKYICCNADEGDSGTFADRMIMEGDPYLLLEGMLIAGTTTGARKGYIYVRSEYPAAITTLKEAIKILRRFGWLGEDIQGSGKDFDIEVRRGAGSYVCGEESAMLESLEGKRGQVRVKPPIPAISGLFGKPTLVHNVLTLASVPFIAANGGKAYARLGTGNSLGTQAFQLSGMVKQPGLIEAGFGLTLRELIWDFGGGMRDGSDFKAAQIGGPLGAYLDSDALDVPLDYESLAAMGAMLGHGGVVVFDQNTNMAKMAKFAFEFCSIESCGKCTPCRIGAQRGVELVDRIILGENRKHARELVDDLCELMRDGSLCAMGGLTPMPVQSALERFPLDFGFTLASEHEAE